MANNNVNPGIILIAGKPSAQQFNEAVAREAIACFASVGLHVLDREELRKINVQWEGSPKMVHEGIAAVRVEPLAGVSLVPEWRFYMVVHPQDKPGLNIDVRFNLPVESMIAGDGIWSEEQVGATVGKTLGRQAANVLELVRRGVAQAEKAGQPAPGQVTAPEYAPGLKEREAWNE